MHYSPKERQTFSQSSLEVVFLRISELTRFVIPEADLANFPLI